MCELQANLSALSGTNYRIRSQFCAQQPNRVEGETTQEATNAVRPQGAQTGSPTGKWRWPHTVKDRNEKGTEKKNRATLGQKVSTRVACAKSEGPQSKKDELKTTGALAGEAAHVARKRSGSTGLGRRFARQPAELEWQPA